MKTRKLDAVIATAIRLDREIAEKTEALKLIKADLVALAETEPDEERTETEGGGWSLTFDGGDAGVARITKPGPKLKSSLNPTSKAGEKLLSKIGDARYDLFVIEDRLVPVEGFRDRVAELLSPAAGRAVLAALTTDSAPTVNFETKDKV